MSIDEIIQELESTKDYPASDPASDEALDGAIDTMRKYQKIEKIIKNAGIFAFDVPEIRRIAEVIRDAKEKIQV